jgi:predicted metal-dependent phosphoesterase TrpH
MDPQVEENDVIQRQYVAEENAAIPLVPSVHSFSGQLDQYLTEAQKKKGHKTWSSFESTIHAVHGQSCDSIPCDDVI